MSNKVIFLDYDGVVNTPMWDKEGKHCIYNHNGDNKVNNFQAVQWVSHFCKNYNYDIVVTSTWRLWENYKECLINGGLREGINIVGRTEVMHNKTRGEEIADWLGHNEVEDFLIFDDEDDVEPFMDKLVKCDTTKGFGMKEYYQAVDLITANKK